MVNILGINLNELKKNSVLEIIQGFLNSQEQHYIVTPNPEMIIEAHEDEEFFYILNQADLSLADGVGLKIAGWLFGHRIPRLTGADLTVWLLQWAQKNNLKILILNRQDGLSGSEKIQATLSQKYPGLLSLVLDINREKFLNDDIINKINSFAPTILFSALGFPYQEKIIYHNLAKLPSVKLALGIGGSFDFITGQIKRASKTWRALGLEWLWRLLSAYKYQDSKGRVIRIYKATFIFLKKIFLARFIYPFLYRPNVACLLYKNSPEGQKILLVEREGDIGHWQLPQGGTDGEDLVNAGARELREEVGSDLFETKGFFKNLYRYKFPPFLSDLAKQARKEKSKDDAHTFDHKLGRYDYKGQKQGLYIAEYLGTDNDIRICFWDHRAWKWVDAKKLPEEVHPVRKASAEIFLAKFQSLNL